MDFFTFEKPKKFVFYFKFPVNQAFFPIAKIYAFWQSFFTT